MSDIALRLDRFNLMHELVNNECSFFKILGQTTGFSFKSTRQLAWSMTDIPDFPMFNSVLNANLSVDRCDEEIQKSVQRASSKDCSIMWWLSPLSCPKDLGLRLEAHGFVCAGLDQGMIADLSKVSFSSQSCPHLHVRLAHDELDIREWCKITAEAFKMNGRAEGLWRKTFEEIAGGEEKSQIFCYIGSLKGKNVTAALLFPDSNIAGLHCLSVIPQMQRCGVGSAMVIKLMKMAHDFNYRFLGLQGAESATSLYEKLGFEAIGSMPLYIRLPGV